MKVIHEEPWSHVLMQDDARVVLTLMIRTGPIENDFSIQLTDQEAKAVVGDISKLEQLVNDICSDQAKYASREIRPSIWPTNTP